MGRTILVTGASGRFGGALCRALSAEHSVVGLDILAPKADIFDEDQRFIQGSILDPAVVERALDGVDAVVHCAAIPGAMKPYAHVMDTNVMGTFNVLEAAGHRDAVKQFVYLSSVQWHGLHEESGGRQLPDFLPITEEHPSKATGYYDTSKVMGEHLCEVYTKRFGKPCVAMRPAWVITEEVEADFRAINVAEEPHLNDYVGTSDLIAAVKLSLEYAPPDGFEAFLFHAEDQRSSTPTAEIVERHFSDARVDGAMLEACDGFGALVDCGRAKERLGWEAKFRCKR